MEAGLVLRFRRPVVHRSPAPPGGGRCRASIAAHAGVLASPDRGPALPSGRPARAGGVDREGLPGRARARPRSPSPAAAGAPPGLRHRRPDPCRRRRPRSVPRAPVEAPAEVAPVGGHRPGSRRRHRRRSGRRSPGRRDRRCRWEACPDAPVTIPAPRGPRRRRGEGADQAPQRQPRLPGRGGGGSASRAPWSSKRRSRRRQGGWRCAWCARFPSWRRRRSTR